MLYPYTQNFGDSYTQKMLYPDTQNFGDFKKGGLKNGC